MFTSERITSLLAEYGALSEELSRILDIMNPYARSITSIEFNGESFNVSYEDCCMGNWDHDSSVVPFSLLGKSEEEIREYIAEQKRIKEENDRVAMEIATKTLQEETRKKELAELARLNAKYNPQTESDGSSI